MYQNEKIRNEEMETNLRFQVFANNPELYDRIFRSTPDIDEDELDWIQPRTEEDVQRLMELMRETEESLGQ